MFGFLKRPVYLGALKNAINAKITLEHLDEEEKMQVYVVSNALYINGGKITNMESALEKVEKNMTLLEAAIEKMSEFELNTLYSMSMLECGIEPYLPREGWDIPPRNPAAIREKIDKVDVINAIAWFRDNHGLSVSIEVYKN